MTAPLLEKNLVRHQELVEVRTIFCNSTVCISNLDGVPAGEWDNDGSSYLDILLHVAESLAADGLTSALEISEVQ